MGVALQLQIGDRYSIITLCALLLLSLISRADAAPLNSVFFIPYIIFELPSMIMMRRVGCRIWLAGIVASWSVSLFPFVPSLDSFPPLLFQHLPRSYADASAIIGES